MDKGNVIFDQAKFTLIIPVKQEQIDLRDINDFALENGFYKKPEFHITVILFSAGREIKKLLDSIPDGGSKIREIEKLIRETNWSFNFIPEYHQLKKEYIFNDKVKGGKFKETRESIIQSISLPAVGDFYGKLNEILSLGLETSFPHITLFVKGDKGADTEGIGVASLSEFKKLNPYKIELNKRKMLNSFHTIILPTRPQPDTLIAIFFLRRFGLEKFPGIDRAEIKVLPILPENKPTEAFEKEGCLLIDIGKGRFDHHSADTQITASDMVANYLNIQDDQAITKLLEYARRDDFFGKGTISNDSLDRAFGLSGLITVLNKAHQDNPMKVLESVLPFLEAHYLEQYKRTKEMPLEAEQKLKEGKAATLTVKQRGNNLKVIYIESDNASLPGFLRSQQGGRYDIVAQKLSSGHINILTRPTKRVDLKSLAALIRNSELMLKGNEYNSDSRQLSKSGRLDNVPEWYFDEATNSILNGGINPSGINPTQIPPKNFLEIIKLGFK